MSGEPPQREFPDTSATAALSSLTAAGPYLPAGAGVMRPGGLVAVCNDVVLHGRRRIVEVGGGASTVLLARLLRQRGSADVRQVVVEHDPQWAGWLQDQLQREDLAQHVTVVQAPLGPHEAALGGLHWYDDDALRDGLDRALGPDLIDLLVVDGPPADTADKVLARYPALPVLRSRLAGGASVVLDDVERPGEQEVLRRWEAETGLRFRSESASAGIALARLPAPTDAPAPSPLPALS